MAEEKEKSAGNEKEDTYTKPTWLETRHSWYANLNITLRQIDIVIGIACAGLAVVVVLIALEAMKII